MRYIYPALMKQYNTYIKNTQKNAIREFKMTLDELKKVPKAQRTERQNDFIRYYERSMPVGTGDCVMNKICRIFEREFDGYLGRRNPQVNFDYTIMKSGLEYSKSLFNSILKLYESYNKRLRSYAIFAGCERVDEYEYFAKMIELRTEFIAECAKICPNHYVLCDIVLDICYRKSTTKRFAWEICGKEIIHNLLKRNKNTINYPIKDENGDICFCGNRFSVQSKTLEEINEYCS